MGLSRVEPSAEARQAAKDIHEMFVAFMDEGFTEDQALTILGQMMAAAAIADPQ